MSYDEGDFYMEITRIGKKNFPYFEMFLGETMSQGNGALGIIEDGEAIGASVYEVEDDICYLKHIEVLDEYRRKGAGTLMLNTAKKAMQKHGITKFLAYFDEDEDIVSFLEDAGFTCAPTMPIMSFRTDSLVESDGLKKIEEKYTAYQCKYFDKIGKDDRKKIIELAKKEGFSKALFAEGEYDPGLSFTVYFNDSPAGVLLAKLNADTVYITLLMSSGGNGSLEVMTMIAAFIKAVKTKSDVIKKICYAEGNERITKSLNKMFKGDIMIEQESMSWAAVLNKVDDVEL